MAADTERSGGLPPPMRGPRRSDWLARRHHSQGCLPRPAPRVSAAIDVLLVLAGFVLGARGIGSRELSALGADAARLVRRSPPALFAILGAVPVLTVSVQPQNLVGSAFADQTLADPGVLQNR